VRETKRGDAAMSNETYEGWTNYETWCVKLWLDNDQGTYEEVRGITRDITSDIDENGSPSEHWTTEQAKRFVLADALKDYVEELNADALDGASMATDLLGAALASVNWQEIADNILSDWDD
jgi:hypothetical protein